MIYLGIDDTDNHEAGGTGRLGRALAEELAPQYTIVGLTRHQLLVDPRVPSTQKNSCLAIHIADGDGIDLAVLGARAAAFVAERSEPGSDPGVCVAREVPESVGQFGRKVQQALVTQAEAWRLCKGTRILLWGLGGTNDGVIGALSAVGLASSGDDGRFVHAGSVRELMGIQPIAALRAAGVAEVRTLEGEVISEGQVDTGGKLRPAFRDGKPIVFVRRAGDLWLPIRLD
jgi:hypothetical protein